jgi:ATP-dependent helicase/nuclease subunit B
VRTFLISPRQNLVEFVADTLGNHRDYSSCLVAFPGKRPAHFLRKALAERSGRSLIPPRIFSMDAFIDFLFEDVLGLAGQKMEAIDAVALLFRIHMRYSSRLGGSRFVNAASFLPLGLKLYRDLEELLIEGVTPEQARRVDNVAGMSLPIQSQERLQALSFFYEEFYREADRMGLTTRSQRYRAVAERSGEDSLSSFDLIVLAGFFALSHAERELFKKLAPLTQTVSIFQDGAGIDTKLDELGLSREGIENLRDSSGGQQPVDVKFYRSPDTHGQIFGLNRVLEQGEAPRPENERDLILIPSAETLFPLVHNCLALSHGSAYNISLGYPLVRTPVYGFLRSLAEVVITMDGNRVHVPTYLSFVLHPYTKNIYFQGRTDVSRMLFHGIETDLTDRQRKFAALEEIEESDELLRRLSMQIQESSIDFQEFKDHIRNIHDRTVKKFSNCRDLEDFAGKVIELIQYIHEHSTAGLHPFFHPFAESLIEHLSVLRKSLLKDMVFQEMADYFNFLRRYAASCHVPFDGTPLNGLQVLGLLETRNLKFDRVFVLDANEDVISGIRKEDSLFPHSVRQELGLPDYRDRTDLTAYYLDVLLKGATEAHLFYVQNDRKERSRLVERLIWEKQKAKQKVDEEINISTISYAITLENRMPLPIPKDQKSLSFLQEFPFSATSLDRYLRCPLSFYYHYILGLNPKDEVPEEIEGQELGKLVHTCLHAFFETRRGRKLLKGDIDTAEMQAIVDDMFSKTYGEEASGSLYLVRRQVRHHLFDFMVRYQIPLLQEKDITVLALEQTVGAEWEGFRLRGRIDRVEKRNNDTIIIDYKTGARSDRLKIRFDKLYGAAREKWSALVGSLQLPFYLLTYSISAGQPIDSLYPMYLMLGRSSITNAIEEPLFAESDDHGEGMKLLEHVMRTLLGEIVDPHVPFEPTTLPARFCPWCEFQSLCGTRWIRR